MFARRAVNTVFILTFDVLFVTHTGAANVTKNVRGLFGSS